MSEPTIGDEFARIREEVPPEAWDRVSSDELRILRDVLAKAREAAEYHRRGYDLDGADYDGGVMVTLMDELAVAVDHANVLA